jgi:hypothetical protein
MHPFVSLFVIRSGPLLDEVRVTLVSTNLLDLPTWLVVGSAMSAATYCLFQLLFCMLRYSALDL